MDMERFWIGHKGVGCFYHPLHVYGELTGTGRELGPNNRFISVAFVFEGLMHGLGLWPRWLLDTYIHTYIYLGGDNGILDD